ncbi:MAG: hypothetical protein M3Y37_03885 [Chloroflexota bacterium]|nr:hypothetical protein [Chloroflexota bacterium]
MQRDSGSGVGESGFAGIPGDPALDETNTRYQEQLSGTATAGDSGASGGTMSNITDRAAEGASKVKDKATSGTDTVIEKAAGGLESLSSAVKSRTESMGGGQIQSVADTAAGTLAQGAEMLRGRDSEQLISDLEGLVRSKPLESLLVAAGVGYLLSRAL